jgi:glycogen operon protein
VFQRRGWFKGRPLRGANVSDIAWFRPDGERMSDEDWQRGFAKSVMVFINGDALRELDDDGTSVRDDSFLLLFNADHDAQDFTMPDTSFGESWTVTIDTAREDGVREETVAAGEAIDVASRSLIVLWRPAKRS